MLGHFAELKPLRLNGRKITKTFDKIMGQIVREAAREWLRTWLRLGVPVETGMAKATLQPLGRYLRVKVAIRPTRKSYYSRLEGTHQDIGAGQDATDFTINDDKTNPGQFVYGFEWTTNVLHYMLKEFYNGPATAGEDALEEALAAFDSHIAQASAKRLPPPFDLGLVGDIVKGI